MKLMSDLDLSGKRVLIREDLNVPIREGVITNDARLRAAARAAGLADERLIFAPPVDMDAHLARLAAADLALDTWPCNGHTTTSDALAAGVPVVTLKNDSFPGRVAASLLHAAGLPGCIADDEAGYVARVLALARDAQARQQLREQIARRPNGLYDTPRFTRDLEALFERMWARALAGDAPSALPA